MSIRIIKPGLLTTVQDLGRKGRQSFGFSTAGAIDYRSHILANQLLNNDMNDASLEMTLQGCLFEVLEDTYMATAGGDMELSINNEMAEIGTVIRLLKGDIVEFGVARTGLRTYIALPGGIEVAPVFASRSTHTRSGIGGFEGRPLRVGDKITSYKQRVEHRGLRINIRPVEVNLLHLILGQQYDRFDDKAKDKLFNTTYYLTKDSDRMGVRLEGEAIESIRGNDIISEPTQLGSVQIPSSGMPIILLNDRQTAGGYTKIATVARMDIPKLSQLRPNDPLMFTPISVEKASALYLEEMEKLKTGQYITGRVFHNHVRRSKAMRIDKLLGGE